MYFIFIAGDEDMFLINNTGSRVIPEYLADGLTASSLALSSHETSQNFGTRTDPCSVNPPRNDRQRRSQGLIALRTKDSECCVLGKFTFSYSIIFYLL